MLQHDDRYVILRYGSVLLGYILTIIPIPAALTWCRPCWLPLIVLFWLMLRPYFFGLTTIWLFGLGLDVLLGTRLGEHALALTIIGFILMKVHRDIAGMDFWLQIVAIGALLLLYQAFIFLCQVAFKQYNPAWLFWLPAVVSMVVWSGLHVAMRYVYTPRQGVY